MIRVFVGRPKFIVHLDELIVQRRVSDRRQVEDRIELFPAKLVLPIERRQILRDEIAAITDEVLEIAGAKIVEHRQARVRKFLLQRENKIRADETGAAGHHQVESRIGRGHRLIIRA